MHLAKAGNNHTISAIAFCVVKGLVCFANKGFRMAGRRVWNEIGPWIFGGSPLQEDSQSDVM